MTERLVQTSFLPQEEKPKKSKPEKPAVLVFPKDTRVSRNQQECELSSCRGCAVPKCPQDDNYRKRQ